MPRNRFQRMVFAFITVVITVHAYVFYSLYVVNGNLLMQINETNSVLAAIHKQGEFICVELTCRYGDAYSLNSVLHIYWRISWEAHYHLSSHAEYLILQRIIRCCLRQLSSVRQSDLCARQ